MMLSFHSLTAILPALLLLCSRSPVKLALPHNPLHQHSSDFRLVLPAEVGGHVFDDVVAADAAAVAYLVTAYRLAGSS
jgi:hypothetical protein